MSKTIQKIKNIWIDYQKLFEAVPAWIVTLFTISVVLMNLMANKVMFRFGNYLAADCGYLLSWIPFLCMDILVKHFGPKTATKINIFAVIINLFAVGFFALVASLPGDGEDYTAFNSVFSCTWFILFGSTVAMIVSAVINNFLNHGIGKCFKNNPDGKLAYVTRSYVSTFIAQFIDNFIFAYIVFTIFAPRYWEGFTPYGIGTCIGTGLLCAVLELVMEIVFSPIGYRITKRWKQDNVGINYIRN